MTLLSFALATGLLLAFLYVVGVDEVVATLLAADTGAIGGLTAVVFCWIAAWSASLRVVLQRSDLPHPLVRTYLAYTTMMFWDNVTPLSTAVADPVAAGVLARAFDIEYERSLAVVITVDFLNFAPSPLFAVFGLLYVALTAVGGERIETIAGPLLAVLLVIAVGSVLVWRHRRQLGERAVSVLGALESTVRRLRPGRASGDRLAFERRVERLIQHLETVAASRRTLVTVLLLAVAGWALLALALWLSLYAVGVGTPVGIALFAVPLVTVTELLPLPGGVGGLEPLLVLLLVPTTGGGIVAVTAGVVLFRMGTHWFPIVCGGAALPVLLYR
ncbi:MAG: flippase-like domain-containing protein [Haloferacaceae archaeon]